MTARNSNDTSKTKTPFAQDIRQGLTRSPKKLSSRYFYDERGDRLFQAIMDMPEYYLTNCEYEILTTYRANICRPLLNRQPFEIIELGAGDGIKTRILLRHLMESEADFSYRPIDISQNALDGLEQALHKEMPHLPVQPLQGEYFQVLSSLKEDDRLPRLVLFLGANIGNLDRQQAQDFLRQLHDVLNPGDYLLLGFDLKKDPAVILNAYNDPAGITAEFNLNLLRRINRELDANFNLNAFKHWESYNPATGETKSYIVSTRWQKVYIGALELEIQFDAWEAIDVELSLKYSRSEIENLAKRAGFIQLETYSDTRSYFVDSLWQVPENA